MYETRLPVDMAGAQLHQRSDDGRQFQTPAGKCVLGPRWVGRVDATGHQAVLLHPLEPVREHVGCEARQTSLEILEAAHTVQEIAHQ